VIDSPDKPPQPSDPVVKRAYKTPKLEVYGDLRKITNTVANSGSPDGGHPFQNKTH
jgi:hypothetical protein